MIKIAVVGDIGSGKSPIANLFGTQFLMPIKRWQAYIKKTKIVLKN